MLPWYYYMDNLFHRLFKHYGVGSWFCDWTDRRFLSGPQED